MGREEEGEVMKKKFDWDEFEEALNLMIEYGVLERVVIDGEEYYRKTPDHDRKIKELGAAMRGGK